MNTLKKITVAFVAAIAATAAMAQNSVEQAIKDFVENRGNGKYITSTSYEEAQEADTLPMSFYRKYKFRISKKSRQFEQLRKAFEDGQCKYYKKTMKPSGEEPSETWSVGYGARSEKTVRFGTHKERNYTLLLSRDSDNPEWRTFYGLVWYDDKENDDNYRGSLDIIYSPDPKKRELKKLGGNIDWDDFNKTMEQLDQSLKSLDLPREGQEITIISPDSLPDGMESAAGNGKRVYVYDLNRKVRSADEFLSRFGTLRSLYLDTQADKRSASYKTSIINKIVSLCKNKASLLSADEKEVCAYGIREMQKHTYNEYDKRMLNIALKAMK